MPAWLAPAIAGGATLAGGLINSAASIWSSNKQMRFQERMSSTAHQREVQDLVKAGLNPALSLKHGGASTPMGARADIDVGADKAVNSAIQAAQVKSTIELQRAQANQANSAAALSAAQAKSVTDTLPVSLEKLRAEIGSALAGTAVSQAQVPEIAKRIEQIDAQMKLLNQQTQTEAVRLQKEKALQVLWKALEDILKKADSNVRLEMPRIMERLKPILPWIPGGSLFMERR